MSTFERLPLAGMKTPGAVWVPPKARQPSRTDDKTCSFGDWPCWDRRTGAVREREPAGEERHSPVTSRRVFW